MQIIDHAASTLLAIDDNPDNLVVIQALIQNLLPGCTLITARSGQEGIDKAMETLPDTILLDIVMPGMDGYETCERLKENPVTAQIPVVMITAVAKDPVCRVKGLEKGADAFIAKPIDPTELIAQVKVALRMKFAEDKLRYERDHLEHSVHQRTMEIFKTEKSFHDLVDHLPVGICIFRKSKALYMNHEYQRLTHMDMETAALFYNLAIHPDDVEKADIFFREILNDDENVDDISFRFYRKEENTAKKTIWVQARTTRLYYQGHRSILLSLMDITRTRELEHLLTIEDKMSSLGRVAAGIAHEIRNPLSSIYINMTLLEKAFYKIINLPDILYDHMGESIREVNIAARRIDKVISRVMDFSKPGKLELKKCDISHCISDAVKLSAIAAGKADVQLDIDIPEDLPHCDADPLAITQVIINLISNAIQAMKEMGDDRKIAITGHTDESWLHIVVMDNGPGIPDHIRDTIFDPFYTTSEAGSGIGLCISRRIIIDHGGRLTLLLDDNGYGARFMISLPLRNPMVNQEDVHHEP